MPNIPSDSVAPFFPLCAWLGRRSPAAAAASVASFSDINGSFACRIKYRSFCDSAGRSPRLSSASSSSFRSFLPSTVNSGVLYVAAFTVNSSEVMSANRVRPFFISEPGLKWMGVWEFVSVGFGDFSSIWFVWLGVRGRWVGGWYVPERLLCSSMCRAFILHTASRLRDSAHGTDPSGQYSGSFPYLCAHARNSAECVCAGVVDAGIPAAATSRAAGPCARDLPRTESSTPRAGRSCSGARSPRAPP